MGSGITAIVVVLIGAGCRRDDPVELPPPAPTDTGDPSWTPTGLGPPIAVTDIAIEAGFQDHAFGHLKRGRACLSADLDNDGWTDVYVGNPGDESHVLLNATGRNGRLSFDQGPVLSTGGLYWGGSAGDLDNDGDVDLFIGAGGNEDVAFDALYENRFADDGALSFDEVAALAGTLGPTSPEPGAQVQSWSSASARIVDFDNDGQLDVFVNSYKLPPRSLPDRPDLWRGANLLWHNQGDGTFVDVAAELGLVSTLSTQNSTFLDYDDDGDMDLFESNISDPNHLWRNMWAEEGVARFEDVTATMALAGGDLAFPERAFASAAADFNGDGWEDLLVFVRPVEDAASPYPEGHVLLLNSGGQGFVDLTPETGLNEPFVNWYRDHDVDGVMGGQIGDLNVDGIPDVWIGQGRPEDGTNNLLFLSTGTKLVTRGEFEMVVPTYENASTWIDVPAEEDPASGIELYPPFPYRTHASCIVDYDQDGIPEVAVINGGPAAWPDSVQEPNRLFEFEYAEPRTWLRVVLQGDGVAVNRSGIGARVTLTARRSQDDTTWERRQWLHAGHGFSAVNDLALFFGLADATDVDRIEVRWPDGHVDVVDAVPVDTTLTIPYGG